MMKRLLFVAPMTALVLVTGCGLFGGGEDYFPMSVGSVWNYEAVSTLESVTAAAVDTISTMTQRSEVTRNTKLANDLDVAEVVATSVVTYRMPQETTYTMVDTSYIREEATCILVYSEMSDTVPDTMAVRPYAVGKTWRWGSTTVEVIAQQDVMVKAGTYANAWKVEVTPDAQPEYHSHYWYGNKAGLVRVHSSQTVGSYRSTYEMQLVTVNIR